MYLNCDMSWEILSYHSGSMHQDFIYVSFIVRGDVKAAVGQAGNSWNSWTMACAVKNDLAHHIYHKVDIFSCVTFTSSHSYEW